MHASPSISVRLKVLQPPAGVQVGMQAGKGSQGKTVMTTTTTGADLEFDFPLSVVARQGRPPKFGGEHVQEDAKGQFVYLRWGQSAGDWTTEINRRTKVYLNSVSPEELSHDGAPAEVVLSINGTAKDGWPACATVPVTRL